MQKLAAKHSKIVCLRNMVDPSEVDGELETEITEECSKFGTVEQVRAVAHPPSYRAYS